MAGSSRSSNQVAPGHHPAKRRRAEYEPVTTHQIKEAPLATALEVDIMILDYLAHKTILACLASRRRESRQCTLAMLAQNTLMTDDFLALFKQRNPSYKPDRALRLRLLMLQVTTLFTQRLTCNSSTPSPSCLTLLRRTNRQRALTWMHQASLRPTAPYDTSVYTNEPPSSTPYLNRNRTHALHELNIPSSATNTTPFYGTDPSCSLLDLFPLFMRVTGLFAQEYNSNVGSNDRLEHLISEFMLQACLEQFLIRGSRDPLVIDEAFSWGYIRQQSSNNSTSLDSSGHPPAGQRQETSSKEEGDDPGPDYINTFFEGDEGTEAEGWFETKRKFLELLLPLARGQDRSSTPASTGGPIADTRTPHSAQLERNLTRTLEGVAKRYPALAFEDAMLDYLEALAESGDAPVLTQLERGQLFDMNEEETREFLTEICGLREQDIGWREFSGLPSLSVD